jgi:probable HAF family extracellular repeat protein
MALALSTGGASSASLFASDAWAMTDLGVLPGGYRSEALALNSRGQVVGTSNVADRTKHAFLWQNGKMIDLGTAPGVIGINERGQVVLPAWRHSVMWDKGVSRRIGIMAWAFNDATQVVGATRLSNGGHHAALWAKGHLRDLGTLGGVQSEAVAITNRGVIVGTSETKSGASHGFLWRNGKMIDLGTLGGQASEVWSTLTNGAPINERGQIVGVSQTRTGAWHAFLWQNGAMTDLGIAVPELGLSTNYAINERGQVLVSTDTKSFVWDKGKTTRLGTLGGRCTEPEGLNDLGDIVGASCLPPAKPKLQGTPHAFIWETGVMTDLGRTRSGPHASRAYGINNRRQIVGATLTGEMVKAGTRSQTTVQHAVLWTRGTG